MNLRICAIVSVLLGSLCLAGCGDDDDDGNGGSSGNLRASCEKICAITQPLHCPEDAPDCVNECQLRATASSKCRTVVEAALACSAGRPASDFSCDDTGEWTLSESACTSETDAVFDCFLDD